MKHATTMWRGWEVDRVSKGSLELARNSVIDLWPVEKKKRKSRMLADVRGIWTRETLLNRASSVISWRLAPGESLASLENVSVTGRRASRHSRIGESGVDRSTTDARISDTFRRSRWCVVNLLTRYLVSSKLTSQTIIITPVIVYIKECVTIVAVILFDVYFVLIGVKYVSALHFEYFDYWFLLQNK